MSTRYGHKDTRNNLFPWWEQLIPMVGTICSHGGNMTRGLLLLLMMVVGVSGVKAQDYSGVYYIANKIWNGDHDEETELDHELYFYNVNTPELNWYLVPAANPQQENKEDAFYSSDSYATNGDENKPFLTTYRTNRDYNSIWIVKKTGSKYYIIHALTGKYVKYEPPISSKPNRRSVHLEAVNTDTPGNVFQYSISTNTANNITGLNIKPTQSNGNDVNGYFNPAGDNWEYYYAHTTHTKEKTWVVGLVGYYTEQGGGSLWPWEDAKAALIPTINVNAELGSFTITPPVATYVNPEDVSSTITKPAGFLPPGCSIRYTTGDGTQDAPTATTGEEYSVGTSIDITDFSNVKAVIVGYGMVLSGVADKMVRCAPPSISFANNTVTIETSTPDATIYYTSTTDGSEPANPTTTTYTGSGSSPLVINDVTVTTKYKAITVKDQSLNSNVASQTVVVDQTMALSSTSFVYTGTAIEPTVTINGGAIPSSEYEVTYSNNVNVGTATATITNKPGGDYYVIGGSLDFEITKAPLTVTAGSQEVTYGSAIPTYSISYSGFVNGETADNLTTAPMATCTYTASSNAGTYDIVPSGGVSTNYSFTYVSGTLTVGQLEAVLSWDNTTLPYNETAQAPTVVVSNLVEGDICTVTLAISGDNVTVTGGVNTAVEKGSYTATATALSNTNYKLPTAEADRKCDFSIVAANVFAISIEGWIYGSDPNNPVPTGNGDRTVTYTYKVRNADDETYSETVPTKAGNYTVRGSIAAEGEYAASEATADFTIEPKSLSIGAAPDTTPADGITIAIARDDEGVYSITLKDGETELVSGTSGTEYDYSKSINDTDSSFGIVTVTGANNYKGGFSTKYAKVMFAKPDQQGNGFVEAGVFEVPDGTGDIATPEGLKAYIVTGINNVNNTVTIEKISYIPEGVPVLLLSDGEISNGFTVKPRNGGTDITDAQKTSNKLKKASGDETARHKDAATIYLLYRGEFVLNIAGVLKDGKIYLDPGGISSGAPLQIVVDNITDIRGVKEIEKTEKHYDIWYSLDGRRLSEKPNKKGLYLKEGKIVVIK